MFGKKRDDNGEKLYRYSIRKYHFGAASVAIAALIFFANGVAKADMAVSPATANTEKVGVAVTGLTEGVPPTEEHSEKSQEVGSEKEAIAKKSVDKSALNQALSDLQAEIAKIDNGKLSSLASQISQLTDESKRLLGDENTSEEAVATLVGRVQAMTEQVRQLQSKENGKEVEDNSLNSKQDSISDKDNEKNTPVVKDKIVEDKRTAVLNKKSTELSAGTENKTITVSDESYIVKEGEVKKELPTYTNEGDGVYKLKDELEFIYKTLEKAGADQSKIQATKEAYDKFNEVFSRGETISQEDFEAAVLNLKKSRDIIESVLKDKSSQAPIDEMINSQPRSSDEELPSRGRGRTRTTRSVREGKVNYANSVESFFEDGKKGDSPYDKYTYIFYSRRQVNAIDNADRRVSEARNQIYADVTPTDSGFKWDIYINRSKYDLSDSVAWFTIPNGQDLKRGSVDISWKSAAGGYATSPNDGTIAGALRAAGFKNVTEGTPQDSRVDKSGNSTVNKKYYSGDLRALSHRGGITGQDPYRKHLETREETNLAEEKFGIIEKSGGKLFYFEPNQDLKTYHLSFETTGNNNINKLAYAVGMKGERTDDDKPSYKSRFLVNQWYARTNGEKDATDSFKFKIIGRGYFKIDQNTINPLFYPGNEGYRGDKNGIEYKNRYDYVNNPLHPKVNGVLTYIDGGNRLTDYNDIDITSYGYYYNENGERIPREAPNGRGAKAQGENFTFSKEENGVLRTLSREALTFDAIRTPGVHTYHYNRSFDDGSHDNGKFSFVTKPKTPTLITSLERQAGNTIDIKAGNGTNGFEMRLYKREANGSLTVVNGTNGQPLTATAGADGVATFNNVKVEIANYVVKTVVEDKWTDYNNTSHSTVESDPSNNRTATDGVPPKISVNNTNLPEVNTPSNPIYTVVQGERFNPVVKVWDNSGNITKLSIGGTVPIGVNKNKFDNSFSSVMNATEDRKYTTSTLDGTVSSEQRPGHHVMTFTVKDANNNEKNYYFNYVIKPAVPTVTSTTTENRILSTDKTVTGRGVAGAKIKV